MVLSHELGHLPTSGQTGLTKHTCTASEWRTAPPSLFSCGHPAHSQENVGVPPERQSEAASYTERTRECALARMCAWMCVHAPVCVCTMMAAGQEGVGTGDACHPHGAARSPEGPRHIFPAQGSGAGAAALGNPRGGSWAQASAQPSTPAAASASPPLPSAPQHPG